MNRRHTLIAAMFFCILPATTRAIDLTTIDRAIEKEPTYQSQPRYCLLVFGKQARTRVWLVVDGQRLYIDSNGNGDLTEPGELLKATPSFRSTNFNNPISIDRSFRVDQIREADGITIHQDFELSVGDDDRFVCSIELARGRRQGIIDRKTASKPHLAARAQDAPIIHFNGPLTLAPYKPASFLTRRPTGSAHRIMRVLVGTTGLGDGTMVGYSFPGRGDEQMVTVDLEFPAKAAGVKPTTRRDRMKLKGSGTYSYGKISPIPTDVGAGLAKVTISIPDSKKEISPGSFDVLIVGGSQDIPTLTASLQTDDLEKRKDVMSALRYCGSDARDKAVRILVKQLEHTDRAMRLGAIHALTEFKTTQVSALMIAALDDPDVRIRAAAIRALRGYDGQVATISAKLVAALSDDNPIVRRAAAYELRSFTPQGAKASTALVDSLDDPDHQVRANAVGSLGVAGPASLKALPSILPLLSDREHTVRSAAATAIAAIDRAAIGPVIGRLKTSPENREIIQELAAKAIRAMGAGVNYNSKTGRVRSITFYDLPNIDVPDITNDDLTILEHVWETDLLSDLTSLSLYGTRVTDDGLRHISHLTNLIHLNLAETRISDEGLKHIKNLTNLRYLSLIGTDVTDDGLVHLQKMRDLSRLRLHNGPITPLELARVAAIPKSVLEHGSAVSAVVFSPDGKTLLTGSHDKTAQLWDVATGESRGMLLQHDGGVWAVAFDPIGETILTGSHDKTARLWDTTTGETRGKIMRHDDHVYQVAFSPNGRSVLTGSYDKTARLWDAVTGEQRGETMHHEHSVSALAFSPDAKTVVTGSLDNTARLWDAATGEPRGKIMKHRSYVSVVAFSPDGKTVLTGSWDATARLWDAATGEPRGEVMLHQKTVSAAKFSPDGKTVLTGSYDNTARLWNAATGEPCGNIMQHEKWVLAVAFSPDGQIVLTASEDKTARLWDATNGEPRGRIMQHKGAVKAVAFSPDGRLLLTGSADNSARLWDVNLSRP